jgi:adenylyl- and sulfurtransferase ThiI
MDKVKYVMKLKTRLKTFNKVFGINSKVTGTVVYYANVSINNQSFQKTSSKSKQTQNFQVYAKKTDRFFMAIVSTV